jgi:hypothetical protein
MGRKGKAGTPERHRAGMGQGGCKVTIILTSVQADSSAEDTYVTHTRISWKLLNNT